jgi:hypothetical protein
MPANRARALQVIDPFLSTVARRYKSAGFIADQVLPSIKVDKMSGQYPVFSDGYWFAQQTDNESTDRTPSREVDYEWSTDTFLARQFSLKVSLTDLEVSQAESELRLRQTKAEFLAHQMNLAREVRVATLLADPAQVTGGGLTSGNSTAAAGKWDTGATTTIEADIKAAKLKIYDACGIDPNTIVIPYKVAYAAALNATVRGVLAYQITGDSGGKPLQLGDRLFPSVFHGMNVLIPKGQISTDKEGSNVTKTEIWSEDVRVLYTDPSAAWGVPSVAYSLTETARTVTRWREIDPDREMLRELERVAEKVVAPNAGWVVRDCLA